MPPTILASPCRFAARLSLFACLAGTAAATLPASVQAHGYGHGHSSVSVGLHYRSHGRHYGGGRYGIHYGGHYGGGRYGIHYGGHYRRGHKHGGGVSFSYSAPLYAPYAWAPAPPPAPATRVTRRRLARALPDMPQLAYTPEAGQDADTQTRDRRECERQAWRQTEPDVAGGHVRTTRTTYTMPGYRPYAPDPLGPAATGAALGALGGAIAGDAGVGAAVGAVVGAASWLLGSASAPSSYSYDEVLEEYVPPPGPDPAALRNAIIDCMQGRGYAVSQPQRGEGVPPVSWESGSEVPGRPLAGGTGFSSRAGSDAIGFSRRDRDSGESPPLSREGELGFAPRGRPGPGAG